MSTDQIWQAYGKEILHYFQRKTQNTQTAQDLRQDVFIRVHQHISKLEDTAKVQQWLSVISRNVLHDHWKREQRLRRTEEQVAAEPLEDDRAFQSMAQTCVENMIGTLPHTYAQPLQWSDIEGFPQQQIADGLGLSLSGAKSRVQRGRQMLKDAIMACCRVELNHRSEFVDAECNSRECEVCNTHREP